MPATYWLDLFTSKTWDEFLAAGGTVSGFREGRRAYVQKMKAGDLLLCYLTGISRFVGLLEVTKTAYEDTAPIWSEEAFPIRVGVKKTIELTPEAGVPIKDLLPALSIYPGKSPESWQGHVQGSPRRWSESDGALIVNAMEEAQANPILRLFDAKLLRRKARKGKHQPVITIPAFEKLRERVNGVLEMGLAKALGNAPEAFLATIAESFE